MRCIKRRAYSRNGSIVRLQDYSPPSSTQDARQQRWAPVLLRTERRAERSQETSDHCPPGRDIDRAAGKWALARYADAGKCDLGEAYSQPKTQRRSITQYFVQARKRTISVGRCKVADLLHQTDFSDARAQRKCTSTSLGRRASLGFCFPCVKWLWINCVLQAQDCGRRASADQDALHCRKREAYSLLSSLQERPMETRCNT